MTECQTVKRGVVQSTRFQTIRLLEAYFAFGVHPRPKANLFRSFPKPRVLSVCRSIGRVCLQQRHGTAAHRSSRRVWSSTKEFRRIVGLENRHEKPMITFHQPDRLSHSTRLETSTQKIKARAGQKVSKLLRAVNHVKVDLIELRVFYSSR